MLIRIFHSFLHRSISFIMHCYYNGNPIVSCVKLLLFNACACSHQISGGGCWFSLQNSCTYHSIHTGCNPSLSSSYLASWVAAMFPCVTVITSTTVTLTFQVTVLSFESFSHQRKLMVFHWSQSDNKSPQVSRTLRGILADLNNAIVWIVSTRPFISKSSSPGNNPLVTLPSAPITIGISATFMFCSLFFFQFSSKI